MKKTFELENLDCAHCAAKMEEKIGKIEGVMSVNVNFVMQKLTIEAEENNFDEVMKKAVKTCKKVEPGCRIKI